MKALFTSYLSQKWRAQNHPSVDETKCLFVSPKGLMKLCKTRAGGENEPKKRWPRHKLRHHSDGGSIYVHATALADFVARSLPKINKPFVLVSGNSTLDVAAHALGSNVVDPILNNPCLIHWYAQNLAMDHPKVSVMPLGLDYHTMRRLSDHPWGGGQSPLEQEAVLHELRLNGPALMDRAPIGYSNWHFKPGNGDRRDVLKIMPNDVSHFAGTFLPRRLSWSENQKFFFTLSPRGVGMDCHRTWEAIMLGSAPIIPDLPINRVFENLPVVIVKNWADLTPEYLVKQKERILKAEFDFAPVLLETWKRRIGRNGKLPKIQMRYQEFMNLTCHELAEFANSA